MPKQKYIFEGSAMQFDKVIDNKVTGTTVAASKKQALSFLTYRYKKDHNLLPTASVKLVGTLEVAYGI